MTTSERIKENMLKNGIVFLIAIFLYPSISTSLGKINSEQTNDFLLIISVLFVAVCFANFAFTYEKCKLEKWPGRVLAHSATGSFMLLTLLLLECITLTSKIVYPSFHGLIFWFSILLYFGIFLYDFWDLERASL